MEGLSTIKVQSTDKIPDVLMGEAVVILPAGVSASAEKYLQDKLLETFGGFTRTFGHGGWRDPATGHDYLEDIAVYTVAMSYEQPDEALFAIAKHAGQMAGQKTVYVRNPVGEVFILPVPRDNLSQ